MPEIVDLRSDFCGKVGHFGCHDATQAHPVVVCERRAKDVAVPPNERWPLLPLLFQVSRCNEVFRAFFKDAFDRLDPKRQRGSSLTWAERVRLALNSYVELILNFAIICVLVPGEEWTSVPARMTDVLSYSAMTITTSGGGNLSANDWPLQVLTSYEIFCGLILLVVCFAIYAGRGVEEVARRDAARDAETADTAGKPEGSI